MKRRPGQTVGAAKDQSNATANALRSNLFGSLGTVQASGSSRRGVAWAEILYLCAPGDPPPKKVT
jgi:hypothetical protein